MKGLIARKIGMTQIFDESGNLTPVTVIRMEPNVVIAKKTKENAGYDAVLLGLEDKKKGLTKAFSGSFPKGVEPKKFLKEFRDFEGDVNIGDSVGIDLFDGVRFVDVTAVSKGKGFQGVMKRWGFSGGRKTHGSKFHREAGGTGQSTTPGKCFKGIKMPGRMGRERVTVLSLKVMKLDKELNLMLIKGAVPGHKDGALLVRKAVKR